MKEPEEIWIDTIRGEDGFLVVGGADLPRNEASRNVGRYIRADLHDAALAAARAEEQNNAANYHEEDLKWVTRTREQFDRAEAMKAAIGPVVQALEAWQRVLRDGRSIEPSITGLGDMIRTLRAAAGAQP